MLELVVVVDGRQREILDVIGTARSPRRLAGSLNRRQEQRHEYANNRDDDQQLDKCETM